MTYHDEFAKNPVGDHLLKHIVIYHCYMHNIGYQDRQRLASELHIPMSLQRELAVKSKKIK
jgi:hypothetical protein